jgi:hypothetical protein
MRTPEQIATQVIKSLFAEHPETVICGDVTSRELCSLLVEYLTSCPKCGAEPGVNIDCGWCESIALLGKMRRGE